MLGRLLLSRPEPGFTMPAFERLAPPPPPELVVGRLEANSAPGDIVADLHGRGGWIARAAVDRQRRAFTLECSPLTRLLAEVVLRPPDLRHLDAGFSALYTAYVTSARCVIPEFAYDLDALCALLAADHAANPSHYAFVVTAEGAIWKGATMTDVGGADAFGHRHKANVGEALAAEIRDRTGIETLASELTYDLRSGEPDSVDSMVATTFANVAMDMVEDGVTGRMVALQDGKYAHTHLPDPDLGPRRINVPDLYNVERFRPRYDGKLGDPMLLVGLD